MRLGFLDLKYLFVIVLQLQVHLYSFIIHLQVVSHGTIAYIHTSVNTTRRDKYENSPQRDLNLEPNAFILLAFEIAP